MTLFSCKVPQESTGELWVGATRSIDQTIPYPYFIGCNQSQAYLYDFSGLKIDSTLLTKLIGKDDTLNFTRMPMKILWKDNEVLNAFVLNDDKIFPIDSGRVSWKFRAKFLKVKVSEKNLMSKIVNKIENKIFESSITEHNPNRDLEIKKYWHFGSNKLKSYYHYFYKNKQIHSEYVEEDLRFTAIGNKLFFSTNSKNSEANPQLIYQILDIGNDGITIRYFDENEEKSQKLKVVELQEEKTNRVPYSRCFDGFQGEYYFYSEGDITYLHGNDYLIKKISENAPVDKGDGYINVHFTINCRGEVGRIGLEQMDRSYQSTQFSLELVSHIIQNVLQLKEWPQIKSGNWNYKDVHAFLMFKIKNGKIIDLCP